jgi:hypothetical protein
MADPLRHDCKLDVAEEILNFIANNHDAEEIRGKIRDILDLTEEDMEDAAEVVTDLSNLMKNQKY